MSCIVDKRHVGPKSRTIADEAKEKMSAIAPQWLRAVLAGVKLLFFPILASSCSLHGALSMFEVTDTVMARHGRRHEPKNNCGSRRFLPFYI